MEFKFNCEEACDAGPDGYAVVDADKLKRWVKNPQPQLIIDTLGQLSAKVSFRSDSS